MLWYTTIYLHAPLQTTTPPCIAMHTTRCYGLELGMYALGHIPLYNIERYDLTLCSLVYHCLLSYHPVTYGILHVPKCPPLR